MRDSILRSVFITIVFCLGIISLPANAALSHDPSLTWQTLHSKNFRVHFHDGLKQHAGRVADIAEDVHQRLSQYFSWQPKEPTDIVLMDEIDFANGYATPIPSNRIVLWLTPPEDGLADYGPWLETLITHEYVHTLHIDKSEGVPAFFQHIFGRHPLFFPNIFQPSWLIEGIATFIETDEQRGIGRGQSSYFDMLMRMESLNGLKHWRQVNQPIATWPTGIIPYLYGVEFYQFLEQKFGEGDIRRWIENYSDNFIPFMVNSTMRKTFKEGLRPLWDEFDQVLKQRYEAQQQAVIDAGIAEGVRRTRHGYLTGKARFIPTGDVIYARQDGLSETALYLLPKAQSEKAKKLIPLNGLASFDVSEDGNVVIAQPERIGNAKVYFDLYVYNLMSKRLKQITHGKRYRYATWGADGEQIVAVRFAAGEYAVDLLDNQGQMIRTVWQGTNGEIVSHIDWSPIDQSIVASVWRPKLGWNIELLSLDEGQWQFLTKDAAINMHPMYSQDGKLVLYSADYDGIFNIYQHDLQTKEVSKLTNVVSGAFHPAQGAKGGIVYTGYSADGYDIHQLSPQNMVASRTEIEEGVSYTHYEVPSLSDDQWTISSYQPYKSLIPTWWQPIFGMDANTVILGASTSGSDPLMRHIYSAALAYDTESGTAFGGVGYSYDGLYPVLSVVANRGLSRETDDDGDLQKVRTSDYLQASVDLPFMFFKRQWALHTAIVSDKEKDAHVEPGITREAGDTDVILGIGASYNSAKRFPLSVSVDDGRALSFRFEDSDVFNSDYQGKVKTLDWREFIPLGKEHVIALRAVAGEGESGSKRFQLGGSDSSNIYSVSPASVGMLFNQRDYPLRGYSDGLSALRGHNMRLYSAEWRFPLRRIERGITAPPLAIDQISASVFYEMGKAWDEQSNEQDYRSGSGLELYADTYIFYLFPVRFRLGYAVGHDEGGGDEFYLRLGTSF